MLLLENTAGTRNSMGSSFEDIQYILEHLANSRGVGICFDTAHAFAAGYDFRTRQQVKRLIEHFDAIIGFEKIQLVHLNDSLGSLGSRKDRHEHIGLGQIGEEGFRQILHSPFRRFPCILETPVNAQRSDIDNLRKVQELAGLL